MAARAPFGGTDQNVMAWLQDLRQQPLFRAFLQSRVIPNMPPAKPWQAETTIADWAHNTGLRDGYLLALQQFGVNLNDIRNDQHGSG